MVVYTGIGIPPLASHRFSKFVFLFLSFWVGIQQSPSPTAIAWETEGFVFAVAAIHWVGHLMSSIG